MRTFIHVNGQDLRGNRKNPTTGRYNSVFVVVDEDEHIRKGTKVQMLGPSWLVYDPTKPMRLAGYGAIAWIETEAPVRVWWGEEEQV